MKKPEVLYLTGLDIGLYFVLLLGFATGLQFPLEYHYDYIGQISTGIPELRTQVSAVGIKANLTIQITSKTDAIAKLSDVEIGIFNDDVDCDLRNYAPFEFIPLADNGAEIEEPFHFKLTQKEGFVMSVPEREVEWITNIKKSVIEIFIIQPILANFNDKYLEKMSEAVKYPVSFDVEEDSLIGRCLYQYTITKIPQKKVIKIDEEVAKFLTYDIQRNIGVLPSEMEINAPDLEDVLWMATRSMDLSNCHGLVLAQRENMGATNFDGHSQNKYLSARSSVGQFLLRGMPGSLRLDRAIIEGAHLSNPLGLQKEKLQTLTNQTMHLKITKLVESPLNLGKTKPIHTWRFEVASPFFDPGPHHHQPWINFYGNISVNPSVIIPLMPETFLTGKVIEHVKVQELRVKVYELLSETASYLLSPAPEPSVDETPFDSAAGIIGHNMMLVTRALSGITEDEMSILSFELFEQLEQKHHVMQMLFMDACIASGDTVAVHAVLKLMMRRPNSLVPDIRSATLMMMIGHSMAAPTLIQLLYPYITSLNITYKPLQTSATLLNFATAANRLCFNMDTYNTSAPQQLFGRAMCEPQSISNLYLPIFAKGLKESEKTWQKAIYMHALANFKLGPTIEIFMLYVSGESSSDITLRSAAIFALSRKYQRDAAKDMVFQALMPIMEDQDEDLGLRQDAFMVLLTWYPNTPWWHAMARLTWYEPFGPFAALVYFTIESMAAVDDPKYKSQSEIASLVLPLAKPFSPPFHYSFKRYYSKYLPDEKINTLIEYSWVTNLENSLPKDLFFFIATNFGGLDVELFEMSGLTRGFQKDVPAFVEFLLSLWETREKKEGKGEEPSKEEDANKKIVEDFLLDMKDQFKLLIDDAIPNELYLNLKFFKNIQYFLPINNDVITGALGQGLRKLIYHLEQGLFLNLNKYIVPVYNEYYFPTEVGLPLIHTDLASLLVFGEGHLFLKIQGGPINATIYDLLKAESFRLECHLNSKISEKVISKHTVLVPWSDVTVESGVDHVKAVNLPIVANVTYFKLALARKFGFTVKPIFDKEPQTVVYGHTVPYTSVGDMVPVTNVTNTTDFKQIAIEKSRRPIVEEEYSLNNEFTGLNAKFQWDSDGNFPVTKGNILEYFRSPVKLLSLLFHPSIKFWKAAIIYEPEQSSTKSAEFSLVLLNVFQKEKISSNMTFHPNEKMELSAEDSDEERVEKLRQKDPGSSFKSVRLSAFWKSNVSRVWDLSSMFRSTRHFEGIVVKYSSDFYLLFNNIPNYFETQYKICMATDVEVPDIPEINTFKARMESRDQIVPKLKFVFSAGSTCTNADFSTFSAKLRISEERRQRLNDELALECNIDEHDPLAGFRTIPTFDKLSMICNFRNSIYCIGDSVAHHVYINLRLRLPDVQIRFKYASRIKRETVTYLINQESKLLRKKESKMLIVVSRWQDEQLSPFTQYIQTNRTSHQIAKVFGIKLFSQKPVRNRFEYKALDDFYGDIAMKAVEGKWDKRIFLCIVIPPPMDLFQTFRFFDDTNQTNSKLRLPPGDDIFQEVHQSLTQQMRYHEHFLNALAELTYDFKKHFAYVTSVNYLKMTINLINLKLPLEDFFDWNNFQCREVSLYKLGITDHTGFAVHADLFTDSAQSWSRVIREWTKYPLSNLPMVREDSAETPSEPGLPSELLNAVVPYVLPSPEQQDQSLGAIALPLDHNGSEMAQDNVRQLDHKLNNLSEQVTALTLLLMQNNVIGPNNITNVSIIIDNVSEPSVTPPPANDAGSPSVNVPPSNIVRMRQRILELQFPIELVSNIPDEDNEN